MKISVNIFLAMLLLGIITNEIHCSLLEPNEPESNLNSNKLDDLDSAKRSGEAEDKAVEQYLEQIQQRLPFKLVLTPYLYNLILKEQLKVNHPYEENVAGVDYDEDEMENSGELTEQKRALSKKESPVEQRNREFRRQQAARWDIGFGKRGSGSLKAKNFMDALYGKRSGLKNVAPKASFGRKQQWDIQYGRR